MKVLLLAGTTESKAMIQMITSAAIGAEVCFCVSPQEAFSVASSVIFDVAILDAKDMDAGRRLTEIYPHTNLIFISSDGVAAAEAFDLNASGYIIRPVTEQKLLRQMQNLRYTVEQKCRVRFQCFGNFDVFVDEQHVRFKYNRTREMLAFLVSRNGSLCSNGQIMSALWGDEAPEAYLRKLKKDLIDTFAALGCESIFNKQRGAIGVDMKAVASDYRGAETLHPGRDARSARTVRRAGFARIFIWIPEGKDIAIRRRADGSGTLREEESLFYECGTHSLR